jgi:hypothetical protein
MVRTSSVGAFLYGLAGHENPARHITQAEAGDGTTC